MKSNIFNISVYFYLLNLFLLSESEAYKRVYMYTFT